MSGKKSIDEIWAELNKKPVPRVHAGGLPGIQTVIKAGASAEHL